MKNLRELVDEIQRDYSNVNYLYRGERKKYKTITSTSSRNLAFENLTEEAQQDVYAAITGHSLLHGQKYNSITGLYYFLREAILGIGILEETNDIRVFSNIFEVLQHYGFPTALIDFTDDIKVAAYFASNNGNVGDVGRILILPKDEVKGLSFDGTSSSAKRPSSQRAHFFLLPRDYDLLGGHFEETYKVKRLEFYLTEEDKLEFNNPDLMSTADDQTASHIVEWYDTHIIDNQLLVPEAREYIKVYVDKLR